MFVANRLLWKLCHLLAVVSVLGVAFEAAPASAQNPFKDLIQDIFGRPGSRDNDDAPAPNLKPLNDDPDRWVAKDYVDQRAPFARDAHQQIRSLNRLAEEGLWKEALEGLQRILDDDTHEIVANRKGDVLSVKNEAMTLLLSAPQDVQLLYQTQYQGLAAQLLADAKTNSDFSLILSIARRYLATPAGREASLLAADYNLDRGEIPSAVRIYDQLLKHNLIDLNDDELRLKISYAYKQLGNDSRYESFLAQAGMTPETTISWGQHQRTLADWLTALSRPQATPSRLVSEVHYPGGTPERGALQTTGEPILVSRWTHAISQHSEIIDETEIILDQLVTEAEAFPPAHQLVTSGNTGVIRTLQGIAAYDLTNGAPLWESQDLICVEHQLAGKPSKTWLRSRPTHKPENGYDILDQEHTALQHPLTSYLFRDHVSHSLSTDGQSVYAISEGIVLTSELQSNYWRDVSPSSGDQFHRDWSSNRITAYNLVDGQVRWMIGGSRRNEAFDLPLAGNFFFGTPLPVAGKLLVIGECQGEINLHCLEPSTGQPLWSTLLAYADIKIDTDIGRRWWTALPAVSNGLVICPTTVGWLVAVDLYTHEIVWMHRYLATQPQEREYQQLHYAMTDLQSLSDRWAPGPPIIVEDKVLMAAPEYDRLVCLHLHDGSRYFADFPRKNYTRVLGVADKQIILAGADSLASLSFDVRKRVIKEFTLTPKTGVLTSIPVLTEEQIFFTTSQNELYHLPLASTWAAEDAAHLPFRKAYQSIGNLFFHQGGLLQLGPFSFTAYEDLQELQAQIAGRLQKNPSDVWAALKRSQLAFSQGDAALAVACLSVLDPTRLDPILASEYREQMMTALIELITSDYLAFDKEFTQLSELLANSADRHLYERLKIQRHLARGELSEAFRSLIALARDPLKEPIRPSPHSEIIITEQQWISARLHALAYSADAPTISMIDDYITSQAQLPDDQLRLVELLATHPKTEPVLLEVARRLFASTRKGDAPQGTWTRAELFCLKLQNSADQSVRSQALLLYADELAQKGSRDQAARIFKRLSDDVLLDASFLRSPAALAVKTRIEQQTPLTPINRLWAGQGFSMNRLGGHAYQSGTGEIKIQNPAEAPVHRFALQHLVGSARLLVTTSDGATHASIPLISRDEEFASSSDIPAWHLGQSLILAHGGYLHCVSLAENSLLWSHPVRVRPSAYELEIERDSNHYMMRQTRGVPGLIDAQAPSALPGMIAYISPELICYYGTRSIVAISPATGELLWEHDKLPLASTLLGTPSLLYLFADHPDESRLLSPADGSVVDQPDLAKMLFDDLANQILSVVDGRFITLKVSNQTFLGFHRPSMVICWEPTINPETGRYTLEPVWEQEVAYKDYLGILDQNVLLLLSGMPDASSRTQSERELFRLDLTNGTLLDLGVIPSNDLNGVRQIYLVPDGEQAYLVVSKTNNYNNYQNSYYDLDGLTFSGKVYGLDLAQRKVMWTQNVRQQTLILDHYRSNPLLVMIYRNGINKEDIYINELRIQALSKPTGQHVLDYKTTTYENFQSVNIDLRAQAVELATYDTRYRIQLDEKATPPNPASVSQPPADEEDDQDPEE